MRNDTLSTCFSILLVFVHAGWKSDSAKIADRAYNPNSTSARTAEWLHVQHVEDALDLHPLYYVPAMTYYHFARLIL